MTFVEYRPNLSIEEGDDTGSGWHHVNNVGCNWLTKHLFDYTEPGFFVPWYYPVDTVINILPITETDYCEGV